MTETKEYAFFEGNFVPVDEAKISIKTHALQYGTGIFEGIRAYWNEEEEEIYIFRMKEHFERMLDSIKILRIECPYSLDELCNISLELLRRNAPRTDTYLRPYAYKCSLRVGPGLQDNPSEFCMYSVPFGAYFTEDEGLKVAVSSWRRLEDNAIPPRAKISGAYANTALARTDAIMAGFHDAIVLTEDGHVSEGSAMNVFIVKNGKLITAPGTDNILVGITLNTVLELAKDVLDIPAVQRKIDRTELYTADEIFFCGTGAEITPVIEVDKRLVADGKMGPITKRVQELYQRITHGKEPRYRHWLTPVYAPMKVV